MNRRLFGIHHPGASDGIARAGVVLCNPFGQEAMRAQRALWVLAERLSRAGHPVLRFDYFGSGDSMGDDLDADLEGWSGDVHEADRELRTRSGVEHAIWIGMRLGGTVALRAAQRSSAALRRLILWDPVVDGERYLDHLRQRHVASLREAFNLRQIPSPEQLLHDPTKYRDEAIGFALSPLMRKQIAELQIALARWPVRPSSIVVLTDPDDAAVGDVSALCRRDPGRVELLVERHGADWTSDTADSGVLVPTLAIAQLVRQATLPVLGRHEA